MVFNLFDTKLYIGRLTNSRFWKNMLATEASYVKNNNDNNNKQSYFGTLIYHMSWKARHPLPPEKKKSIITNRWTHKHLKQWRSSAKKKKSYRPGSSVTTAFWARDATNRSNHINYYISSIRSNSIRQRYLVFLKVPSAKVSKHPRH